MSVSSVTLVGTVAREPIVRKYDTLVMVDLRKQYRDKHGEMQQYRTVVMVRAVGQTAIASTRHISTGDLVAVTGELESRKDQDGSYHLGVTTIRGILQLTNNSHERSAQLPQVKRPASIQPDPLADEDDETLDINPPF